MTILDSGKTRAWTNPSRAPSFFSTRVAKARRFYLNLAPPKSIPLAVVCGGVEQCACDYAIQRKTFPYYSIEFVAAGKGSLTLQNRNSELHAGSVFVYGPGIPHDIRTDASERLVKYFVDFSGQKSIRLLKASGLQPGQMIRVTAPGELQFLFDELVRNGLRSSPFTAAICGKLLECLTLKLAELSAPAEGIESPAFVTYQRCRRYMQSNSERLRTLEQVAAECHVNPAYLCRLFRRFDHETPYRFLLRLRMNAAAERLRQPDAMVKQVAQECGFADPFHFSRAFKSVFGLSPDAFRKLR